MKGTEKRQEGESGVFVFVQGLQALVPLSEQAFSSASLLGN